MDARPSRGNRFSFVRKPSPEPMAPGEHDALQSLIARLVARAYAAEHPKLVAPRSARSQPTESSGAPLSARADVDVPAR
jgi:hypothetical protein